MATIHIAAFGTFMDVWQIFAELTVFMYAMPWNATWIMWCQHVNRCMCSCAYFLVNFLFGSFVQFPLAMAWISDGRDGGKRDSTRTDGRNSREESGQRERPTLTWNRKSERRVHIHVFPNNIRVCLQVCSPNLVPKLPPNPRRIQPGTLHRR
jgi:hypothetical protein